MVDINGHWCRPPTFVWEREGANPIKQQGKGGQKLVLQSAHSFFSSSSISISAEVYFYLTYKSLSPQCILIDSLRNLLRPPMAIDEHRAQPIMVDNVYR